MFAKSLALGILPIIATATPITNSLVQPRQTRQLNVTAEYGTMCKTCPYSLCTNVIIPQGGDNVTATCWTNGEQVGDTTQWLGTTNNCYVSIYDLLEYDGDFTEELNYCGRIPLDITKEPAKARYLSECKWGPSTSDESMAFVGRDDDITLTCWVEGSTNVLGNPYWYKTTDNCHVSETGLWHTPDRDALDFCGPSPGPRINESAAALALRPKEFTPVPITTRETENPESLSKRWLQRGKIGEEYAGCRSCASWNSTCTVDKVYEYNQTVISQCYSDQTYVYPNGTIRSTIWMLTTDWCYVDSNDFWEPPYDHYRYPGCQNWGL